MCTTSGSGWLSSAAREPEILALLAGMWANMALGQHHSSAASTVYPEAKECLLQGNGNAISLEQCLLIMTQLLNKQMPIFLEEDGKIQRHEGL